MVISSRTPEGMPHRCPVCDLVSPLENCFPGGDTVCPACGHLLWQFRDAVQRTTWIRGETISPETLLVDLEQDSVALIELVLEFEDAQGISISDQDYAKLRTVGDFLRLIGHFSEIP